MKSHGPSGDVNQSPGTSFDPSRSRVSTERRIPLLRLHLPARSCLRFHSSLCSSTLCRLSQRYRLFRCQHHKKHRGASAFVRRPVTTPKPSSAQNNEGTGTWAQGARVRVFRKSRDSAPQDTLSQLSGTRSLPCSQHRRQLPRRSLPVRK